MEIRNDQYQRDVARIEAHKLALREDEYRCLADRVLGEVRKYERYLREEHGAVIVLHDYASPVTVENIDGLRRAVFTFNSVRFEVDVRGKGLHCVLTADVNADGRAVVRMSKFGQSQGEATIDNIITTVHHAIDSITDLPQPLF